MKKKLLIMLAILMLPMNVYAYSDKVIVGGDNIGIELKYEGVMVIGFYEINNELNDDVLKIGDYITSVNNNKISSINDFIKEVEKDKNKKDLDITIKRNNKEINATIKLIDNKTGLYVKDSINGIGTISYIDPETKIYGALGHEIIDSESKSIVSSSTGSIYDSKVSSIDKSKRNEPGSKNAVIDKSIVLGDISKNTNHGIFGSFNDINSSNLIDVGKPEELKKGKAIIKTVTKDKTVHEYEINITKIDLKHSVKNIYFEITDQELLEECGGIVQGMSGSPIIQDNKVFGAVTHVVIDNPKNGYGVFITTMLEEGEK